MNNDCLERNKLIDSIEQLNFEIDNIKEEIEKIEAKDAKIRARSKSKIDIERLYWKIPVSWMDTVFYTRKRELKELSCATLSKEDCYCITPFFQCTPGNNYTRHIAQIAVLCEDIIESEEGICLSLRDPYRRCKTLPLDITTEKARNLIGKIIIVDGHVNTESRYESNLDLGLKTYRYKTTEYLLKGPAGKTDEVTDIIAKLALELKGITDEEEAIKGITALQNYVTVTMENCKILRLSPTELRMLVKNSIGQIRLYGIKFDDGEFWFMEDTGDHYYDMSTNDFELHMIEKNLISKEAIEHAKKNKWAFHCINEDITDLL